MADHGKLFSAPMLRALLAGTKTQTRRTIGEVRVLATPESAAFTLRGDALARAMQNAAGFLRVEDDIWTWEADAYWHQAPVTRTRWNARIGHAPGDRLWVREAWRAPMNFDRTKPRDIPAGSVVSYEAGGDGINLSGKRRASMHMPRWASRLTLPVTEVRVQRLQDITENDALAEGVVPHPNGGFWVPGVEHPNPDFPYLSRPTAREMYAALWDVLNGSGAWGANPWVTVTSFTVRHRNIDEADDG
ncbi:hypothetical protein [Ancylobacter defluvii]|uniref:Uncharacterized protein n=1 Tax=Ancylobacter defluvii TaxID=1282440 RepID=A0A9W6K440_9HYPH|nr:hypothetical protein [Ancylobacter defluvii]MBS7588237.1 hypothetical protein [Ancylobacter defluvii]GLK86633.1 hypothetical protein GCM10017653_47030 [Ancylobacter defluvii]